MRFFLDIVENDPSGYISIDIFDLELFNKYEGIEEIYLMFEYGDSSSVNYLQLY